MVLDISENTLMVDTSEICILCISEQLYILSFSSVFSFLPFYY